VTPHESGQGTRAFTPCPPSPKDTLHHWASAKRPVLCLISLPCYTESRKWLRSRTGGKRNAERAPGSREKGTRPAARRRSRINGSSRRDHPQPEHPNRDIASPTPVKWKKEVRGSRRGQKLAAWEETKNRFALGLARGGRASGLETVDQGHPKEGPTQRETHTIGGEKKSKEEKYTTGTSN